MSSRYTAELEAVRDKSLKDGLFRARPGSWAGKIECVACHSQGYPRGSWMDSHIEGHLVCACGKVAPRRTFKMHANRCATWIRSNT